MFTLSKIYNSGVNVAEPCRMYTASNTAYRIGSALVLTDGKLTNAGASDKPLYIAAESAAANEKSTVLCYPVSSNMIFEVPVADVPTGIKIGNKVTLAVTDGFASKVGISTEGGVATVVDTCGATKSDDKIFVKFE